VYYQAISQLAQNLKAVEIWLNKAKELVDARNINIDVLLNGRLAPDMKPFIYQVQSASDYLKGGAAWLSGQKPPVYDDNEKTIDELRARIQRTVAFVESLTEEQFADAAGQKVSMSWAPEGKILVGQDYLLQMVIPNAYFHIAMAYAILRHHGVDIGKMDFLGPISWVSA
jgi:uncharacterized protein